MRQTIESVLAQSVKPDKWVIVDDGSTDGSAEILKEYSSANDWIQIITRPDRGRRSVGPGVIDAFYEGYAAISPGDYTYLCKLDLDLRLPRDYFQLLMRKMREQPDLATVSGKAYLERNGRLVSERHGDEISIGASKFYRIDRFLKIGGFVRGVMWDGIDCHLCRMHGWSARSYDEENLRFVHLRPMGSSQTSIRVGRMRHGSGQYFMGTGLLWMLVTAVYRIPERPYVIGGLYILAGWLRSFFKKEPRFEYPGFRAFLRQYHRDALVFGKRHAVERSIKRAPLRAHQG